MGNIKRCTKKILSILIIIAIIINLMPNFGLLSNLSKAMDLKSGIILRLDREKGIWTDDSKVYNVISLDIIAKDINITSFVLPLIFNVNKLKPAYYYQNNIKIANNAKEFTLDTNVNLIDEMGDKVDTFNANDQTSDTDWSKAKDGKIILEFCDQKGSTIWCSGEQVICTINFITDSSITDINQIGTDLINIDKKSNLFEILNVDTDEVFTDIDTYFSLQGINILPTVQSLSIKTDPTQGKTYLPDEEIDLTNGELTATYTDGSTKDISMKDENVTVKTGEKVGAIADIDNPKLTFEYEDCTVDLDITVIDIVEKIEFYDKNNIISDSSFDDETEIPKESLYIKATKKSGNTEEIKLNDSKISLDSDRADIEKVPEEKRKQYANKVTGIQTIEITYTDEYVTKTTDFTILVNDSVDSIEVSTANPPKKEYVVNDSFAKTGAITVIGASGLNYGDIEMSSDNVIVTEMDGTAVDLSKPKTNKELKVTYGGVSTTYTINVSNTVKSIQIDGIAMGKYNQGLTESNFSGITLTEIMADGTNGDRKQLDFSWVDTSKFDNTTSAVQDLPVNYPYNGKTIEGVVKAKVEDELLGIRVENLKDEYVYKDELDCEGAELYIQYVSGEFGVNVSDYDLSDPNSELRMTGFDSTKIENNQVLTFTYNDGEKEVTTTAQVNIDKATPDYTVPTELEGYEGDDLSSIDISSYTGFSWADGTKKLIAGADNKYITKMTYTPTDTTHYKVVNDIEVVVKVIPKEVSSIAVTTAPAKENYIEGQSFEPTGMKITVKYNDSTTATIDSDYDTNGVTFAPSTSLQTTDTEITVTYRTKTATTPITVESDYVTGIKVIDPKNKQSYGKTIDLNNVKIQKTWASGLSHGTNDTQDVTLSMISSSDIDSIGIIQNAGTITITVTYTNEKGTNLTDNFDIEVEDAIKSITMNSIQTEYYIGDTIDSNLAITVNYVRQPSKTIKITDASWDANWITGIDMSTPRSQTLTIAYGDDATLYPTQKITVKDYVGKIKVTNNKSIYKLNEGVDFSEIKVEKFWKSNDTIAGNLANTEYTISPTTIDTSAVTTLPIEVSVSYKNEKNETLKDKFYIQVINATEGAVIGTLPTTMPKKVDDTLDLTGGTITINKQDGTETVAMTDPTVKLKTQYNPKTIEQQQLAFEYTYKELDENGEEKTITIPVQGYLVIELEDYWTETIKIDSTPSKCIIGNDMDLSKATVSKLMASGALSETTPIKGSMISNFDKNTEGTQTVTVTYWGKTATFNITVVDEFIGISMNTLPDKTEYTQGEDIDVTGGKINVTKSSGTQEIAITKEMITGYDPEKIGQQVITVTYGRNSTEFVISVKARTTDKPTEPSNPDKPTTPDKPTKPNKPTTPSKPSTSETVKYTVTFIDYDGEILKTEVVESGKSATAPVAEERAGYRFLGWDKEFDEVVEDMTIMAKYEEIVTAKVNAPSVVKVEKGQNIDLSDITMDIFDKEGNKIDEIPVTIDMISGFNPDKIGLQTVTITYTSENGEKYTTTFKVKVEKPVETLGVKDEVVEKEENDIKDTLVPAIIGIGVSGLLLLLIAAITKKNVEIYAVSEEERKLIGKEKISKKNTTILLDQYKSKISENESIEIEINDKAIEKLKDEQIEIVINNKTQKSKVKSVIKVK